MVFPENWAARWLPSWLSELEGKPVHPQRALWGGNNTPEHQLQQSKTLSNWWGPWKSGQKEIERGRLQDKQESEGGGDRREQVSLGGRAPQR